MLLMRPFANAVHAMLTRMSLKRIAWECRRMKIAKNAVIEKTKSDFPIKFTV